MGKLISCVFLCLTLLLLMGCQVGDDRIGPGAGALSLNSGNENKDVAVKETRSPENNDVGEYWNGGEWGDQPVVSLEHGISKAAHTEVVSCGLNDVSINDAIKNHLNIRTLQSEDSKIVVRELNEFAEPVWIKSITVKSLIADVFLIKCRDESPY